MGMPWGAIARIGLSIAGVIVPGVAAIENIATKFGRLKGKDKQDAVVELVKQSLALSESLTGKDLLEDADVEQATRGVIDAVVALQNIVAQKHAAAAQ